MDVSELMMEVVALAERLGVKRINELPGCWELQVDDDWWIACNGHREPMECSRGMKVQPFEVGVYWGDWPAGQFGAGGGVIASGAAANEETLLAALKARGEDR